MTDKETSTFTPINTLPLSKIVEGTRVLVHFPLHALGSATDTPDDYDKVFGRIIDCSYRSFTVLLDDTAKEGNIMHTFPYTTNDVMVDVESTRRWFTLREMQRTQGLSMVIENISQETQTLDEIAFTLSYGNGASRGGTAINRRQAIHIMYRTIQDLTVYDPSQLEPNTDDFDTIPEGQVTPKKHFSYCRYTC